MYFENIIKQLIVLQLAVKFTHWSSKSYSEHEALGELYDALSEHIDTLVETYQGKYKVCTFKELSYKAPTDICAVCKTMISMIVEFQNGLQDTYLSNQLDEIVATIYKAIYKLENLK